MSLVNEGCGLSCLNLFLAFWNKFPRSYRMVKTCAICFSNSIKMAKLLTSELRLTQIALAWYIGELHVKGRPEGRKGSSLHPTRFSSLQPFLLLSAVQARLSSTQCAAPAAGSLRKNQIHMFQMHGTGHSVFTREWRLAWSTLLPGQKLKESDALDTQVPQKWRYKLDFLHVWNFWRFSWQARDFVPYCDSSVLTLS